MREIAGARRLQGHAGEDAFDVADTPEPVVDVAVALLFDQGFDRLIPLPQFVPITQGAV